MRELLQHVYAFLCHIETADNATQEQKDIAEQLQDRLSPVILELVEKELDDDGLKPARG